MGRGWRVKKLREMGEGKDASRPRTGESKLGAASRWSSAVGSHTPTTTGRGAAITTRTQVPSNKKVVDIECHDQLDEGCQCFTGCVAMVVL
jgi:hypothetical protein